jgi:L-threonylcarbamoyladenylate synthase
MDLDQIKKATELLRAGELVAFPTETVYGLGADAGQPHAVAKIFATKGRPQDHPLIVHLGSSAELEPWAQNIPNSAYQLAKVFWPGPLTLILERGKTALGVTGGQESVGLRVPSHPVAQSLLKSFGGGVAAPSANRFGHVSPTQARHVHEEFGEQCPFTLDGGNCTVGLESTILSLVDDIPTLLRPGAISRTAIQSVLGRSVVYPSDPKKIRVSGALDSHYAPRTPVVVMSRQALMEMLASENGDQVKVALMSYGDIPQSLSEPSPFHAVLAMPSTPEHYGQFLYATLRNLDLSGSDLIVVDEPPNTCEAWEAINDRLSRAAYKKT